MKNNEHNGPGLFLSLSLLSICFFILSNLYLVHILTVFFSFFSFSFSFSFPFPFPFPFPLFLFLVFLFFLTRKTNKFQSTEMKDYRAQKPTNQYKETKDLVLLDIITRFIPSPFSSLLLI